MKLNELNEILARLDQVTADLENTYIENGGEITEQTEQAEQVVASLKDLLTTEGIDILGGWLKASEDRKKALKAEKEYVTRQINAIDRKIDFIKVKINQVMSASGQDKIKGCRGYSFTATNSVKTDVDKEVLNTRYADRVQAALAAASIPEYIGVTLTASSTKAEQFGLADGDGELFITTSKPSVRFCKPKSSSEE